MENMAAFDALPPRVRHELRHSIHEFGTVKILGWVLDGYFEEEILATLRDTDGRRGPARAIERSRPGRPPSIKDRRARRTAAAIVRRLGRRRPLPGAP